MSRNTTLNWAIVGYGQIARDQVAPALTRLDGVKLAAVCDVSREAGEKAAAKYRCSCYTRLEDVLADKNVDIVYIATPNSMHCEQAIAAARNGKHVFCEKPMALTVEDCGRMIAQCAAAGVKLGIGCMGRFNAYNMMAKSIASQGTIGTIRHMRGWFSFVNGAHKAWRYNAAMSGGGPIMDIGIHLINLLRFFLPSPVFEVQATGEYRDFTVEQTSAALLRLDGGVTCELACSYEIEPAMSFELLGEQGSIKVERSLFQSPGGAIYLSVNGEPREAPVIETDPYTGELGEMTEAVRNGGPISSDGISGQKDMEIAQAWLESMKTGHTMNIPRCNTHIQR